MSNCFVRILFFLLCLYGHAQECPRMQNPINGSVGVPVDALLRWSEVNGIDGYLISLGTTPGGVDILNRRSAGLNNTFSPELGLPDDTRIYVTISLFVTDGTLIDCPGETFTTEDVTTPPDCTQLLNPTDIGSSIGSVYWAYAPTATGYRVSIGTFEGGVDLADNIDVGNVLSYRPIDGLPLDQELFITVVPYNENGEASGCSTQNITYSQPEFDCTPFEPLLNIPDQIGICLGASPPVLSNDRGASGYRWIQINDDGTETLLSEEVSFSPPGIGLYRYEAYNNLNDNGSTIECKSAKQFSVVSSEAPIIESIDIIREASGLEISVVTSGIGDYEYALDNQNGPYQANSTFSNVESGDRVVYVRDRNGCGSISRLLELDLSPKNFPSFFTPNQDGFNDFWQFLPSPETGEINVEYIRIYNRYGQLIRHLDPRSEGWDGTFNGRLLPESDYWFRAVSFNGQEIRGHFTLKR